MGASNNYMRKQLDALRNQTTCVVPTGYLSLHTADPSGTAAVASGNEASGESYARQAVAFAAATSGETAQIKNSKTVTFTSMPAGTFTHFGIWNHATTKTDDSYIWCGQLTSPKTIEAGDSLTLNASSLTLTIT